MWRLAAAAAAAAAIAIALCAAAQASAQAPATADNPGALPAPTRAALRHAGVGADALSALVVDLTNGRELLRWRAHEPVNPASVTKLVTTAAALDRLGPAWQWRTPVWLQGTRRGDVLEGSVFIRGSGDPTLVLERVWLLLRRIQEHGVREIRGDIVLDGSAFEVPDEAAGDFDGEALRPYNVRAAALMLNFRAVRHTFVPDAAAGVASVQVGPALPGTQTPPTVPLGKGACSDWRALLKARFEPGRTRFDGHYPAGCATNAWQVADPQPATYDARLIASLWQGMGGRLGGSVRPGAAPTDAAPTFEHHSPPLAEVVRDINKFSNNVMAQQLFLSLALHDGAPLAGVPPRSATPQAARDLLARWLVQHTQVADASGGEPDAVVIDNGSGLSRTTRVSAARLARLLVHTWHGPVMSELMSSLPVAGVDGTLRRSGAATGRAHLKTGALRDVAALAGYVLSHSGRRYALVVVVNHASAAAARPALETLVQWALHDGDGGTARTRGP